MKQYKVIVSSTHSIIVTARTKHDAKEAAWNDIKDGYTYGWRSREVFMKDVNIEEV